MNDFGESFPHKLHYRRRRRSLNDDLSGLRVHYRIDAFGEHFHLNLTAHSGFIAPSYTVTHLGAEQSSNATDSHDPSDMRHCFFRGHVNAKSAYPAVFSLCTGLVSIDFSLPLKVFLDSLNQATLTGLHAFSHFNGFHPCMSLITRSSSEVCRSVTRASVTGLMSPRRRACSPCIAVPVGWCCYCAVWASGWCSGERLRLMWQQASTLLECSWAIHTKSPVPAPVEVAAPWLSLRCHHWG